MKKILEGACRYHNKPARIKCKITDERGYVSITGEIIPYRCRTPHVFGCVHEEIAKAFPKLKPYLHLHFCNVKTATPSYWIGNALCHIANDEYEVAQKILRATDEEMNELVACARYGLCKMKRFRCYYYDEDSERVFEQEVNRLGLRERLENKMKEFYKFVETL